MIQGHCRTNLDDYKWEEWPTMFVAVPKVGERVRGESGAELKVCHITHYCVVENGRTEPRIEVELTKS